MNSMQRSSNLDKFEKSITFRKFIGEIEIDNSRASMEEMLELIKGTLTPINITLSKIGQYMTTRKVYYVKDIADLLLDTFNMPNMSQQFVTINDIDKMTENIEIVLNDGVVDLSDLASKKYLYISFSAIPAEKRKQILIDCGSLLGIALKGSKEQLEYEYEEYLLAQGISIESFIADIVNTYNNIVNLYQNNWGNPIELGIDIAEIIKKIGVMVLKQGRLGEYSREEEESTRFINMPFMGDLEFTVSEEESIGDDFEDEEESIGDTDSELEELDKLFENEEESIENEEESIGDTDSELEELDRLFKSTDTEYETNTEVCCDTASKHLEELERMFKSIDTSSDTHTTNDTDTEYETNTEVYSDTASKHLEELERMFKSIDTSSDTGSQNEVSTDIINNDTSEEDDWLIKMFKVKDNQSEEISSNGTDLSRSADEKNSDTPIDVDSNSYGEINAFDLLDGSLEETRHIEIKSLIHSECISREIFQPLDRYRNRKHIDKEQWLTDNTFEKFTAYINDIDGAGLLDFTGILLDTFGTLDEKKYFLSSSNAKRALGIAKRALDNPSAITEKQIKLFYENNMDLYIASLSLAVKERNTLLSYAKKTMLSQISDIQEDYDSGIDKIKNTISRDYIHNGNKFTGMEDKLIRYYIGERERLIKVIESTLNIKKPLVVKISLGELNEVLLAQQALSNQNKNQQSIQQQSARQLETGQPIRQSQQLRQPRPQQTSISNTDNIPIMKCIDRKEIKQGSKIYKVYTLIDRAGRVNKVVDKQLKYLIGSKQIKVINLTLTSDNRLIINSNKNNRIAVIKKKR